MERAEIDRVMDLAAEVFADHGFSGVGMRELCSRCGIAAPTLYHYFGSKEQLFDAVCLQKYRKALGHLRHELADDPDPSRQLAQLCELTFDLLVHDRVLFLLLRRDLVDGSISGRQLRSRAQYEGIHSLLTQVIERIKPAAPAADLAFTAASLIFGYCEFVHVSRNLDAASSAERLHAHRAALTTAVHRLIIG